MKKICFILLIAIGLTISCYSIPQFILDNQVTLTPEQKAEYERKVRERPDEYTYNPLHVGDKWWYLCDNYPFEPTVMLFRHVFADTLINGSRFFKVAGIGGSQSSYWLINVDDNVMVYDAFNADNNITTELLLNENFAMNSVADSSLIYSPIGYNDSLIPWVLNMYEPQFCNIFGEILLNKMMIYRAQDVPVIKYIQWSPKFGPVYQVSDFSLSLAACLIDNVFYGDPSVLSEDNISTIYPNITMDIYPNPFSDIVTVKLNNPFLTNRIKIYNCKGQLVKTLDINSNNEAVWNGKDSNDNIVSAGLYFCQYHDKDNKLFVKKIVKIN